MTDFFVMLYPLVTILSLSGYIPQIYALLHATSAEDNFALSTWMIWIVTAGISLGYGYFHLKDAMFCATTGLGLILMILLVSLIVYNRHFRFRKLAMVRI